MESTSRTIQIGAVIGLLVLAFAGVWYISTHQTIPEIDTDPDPVTSNTDDTEIRKVVTAFGTKLQMVSLSASTDARADAMLFAYAPYVAPELIAKWAPEGAPAFGRQTSSPWPERIDIVEVRPNGERFVVEGNVIEVTSVEAGSSTAVAAVYPVILELERRGVEWLIVKADKGAYSELPTDQTIVGVWDCLPHKDTSGPQTMECAFGIEVDKNEGQYYAVNTARISGSPLDFVPGTKVEVTGMVVPVDQLSGIQEYDIDGVINATTIEKI